MPATHRSRTLASVFARASLLGLLTLSACALDAAEPVDEPQTVEDEAIEAVRANRPVALNTSTTAGAAIAVGAGYAFVTDYDLESDCDAPGYLRRLRLDQTATDGGQPWVQVQGSIADVEVVEEQVYYAVNPNCGTASPYIGRRSIHGGPEVIVAQFDPRHDPAQPSFIAEIEVRAGLLFALGTLHDAPVVLRGPASGGALTQAIALTGGTSARPFAFENMQLDGAHLFLRESTTRALYRAPALFSGSITTAERFATTGIGDYLVAGADLFYVIGANEERVERASASFTGPRTGVIYAGAGLRGIANLSRDAGNLYFSSASDRSISRYEFARRRVSRLARSTDVDALASENALTNDSANLYWLQAVDRDAPQEAVRAMRLAKTWSP